MTAKEMGFTVIGQRYLLAIINNTPDKEYWRDLSRTEVSEVETIKSASLDELPLLLCQVTTEEARNKIINRLRKENVNV